MVVSVDSVFLSVTLVSEVQLANASPHGLKVIVRIPTCEKKKEKKAAKDSAKAA